MLDLETMSTASNPCILAIGAVEFDNLDIIDEFYIKIDLQSCMDKGLAVDASTIMWWLSQDKEARDEIRKIKGTVSLKAGLQALQAWFPSGNVQVWGNGADADNVWIMNAFKAFKAEPPWKFYMNRCFRTMKSSFPSIEIENTSIHHNALDDAKWQAAYLQELVAKNKLKDVL